MSEVAMTHPHALGEWRSKSDRRDGQPDTRYQTCFATFEHRTTRSRIRSRPPNTDVHYRRA